MKTAFKIIPEISSDKDYNLLIEIGRGGLSMTWYTNTTFKIEGLFIYHASKNTDDYTFAMELQQLLENEVLPPYISCIISYNFKEGMPVPDIFYDESASQAILDDIYGLEADAKYFTDRIHNSNLRYIYRIPGKIDDVLMKQFLGAMRKHTNTCLIASQSNDGLYCVIYNSYIKCILYKDHQLQIVQSYEYVTPSDVAYHLLNICNQHNISPESVVITLSGFIDQQSGLFEEIYRYFLNVQLDDLPSDTMLAEEIKEYPVHFFSYIVKLIQCA